MTTTISAAEAKARFAEHLRHTEQGHEIIITRHGKAVAALVPAEDLAQLSRLRAARPEAGLAGLAGGWEGSEALVEEISTIRWSSPRRRRRLRAGATADAGAPLRRAVRTAQRRQAR